MVAFGLTRVCFSCGTTRMDQQAISNTLQALAKGKDRSTTAQLRDILVDVEAALAAGVTHASVLSALKQHGLDIPPGTFKATLKRLRSQGVEGRQSPSPQPSTAAEPPGPSGTADQSTVTPQEAPVARADDSYHDPRDLYEIFRSTPDLAALSRIAKQRRNTKP